MRSSVDLNFARESPLFRRERLSRNNRRGGGLSIRATCERALVRLPLQSHDKTRRRRRIRQFRRGEFAGRTWPKCREAEFLRASAESAVEVFAVDYATQLVTNVALTSFRVPLDASINKTRGGDSSRLHGDAMLIKFRHVRATPRRRARG